MAMRSKEDYATLAPEPMATPYITFAEPESLATARSANPAAVEPIVPPPPQPSFVDPVNVGRYRILRVLGQGGMGKVYEARDTKLERIVALKVMLPESTTQPAARERFLREARTMAAVHNDHVVTVFEVDEAGDMPYLAMELLHGQSLSSWLGEGERPRIGDVIRIGREIAMGLAAANAKGLIHRDIKPANLWLEQPSGRIKILDFGLARPVSQDSSITHSGAIMGTPYYMSPEQARGKTVDCRSDLFSLGVVLYQLCTGTLPFRGNSVTAVLTALAIDLPAPVLEKNPNVPNSLSELVMRLLEKDPSLRPQSAEQVVQALRAIEAKLPNEERSLLNRSGVLGESAKIATLGPNAFSATIPDAGEKSSTGLKPSNPLRVLALVGMAVLLVYALGTLRFLLPGTPNETQPSAVLLAAPRGEPIRIGVVYSRTGPMAIGEKSIFDGVSLAVHEINEQGGVLGRPVEIVAEDGQSDENVFAKKAQRLIESEKVVSLFGCWSSACRKAVTAVVEKHDHLLFYPTCYEGMECSANVVYGGGVPNQQILPALSFIRGFQNKKRWFLVGLDVIYSRAAHAVIQDDAKASNCVVVGDEFLSADSSDIRDLIEKIEKAAPDVIINTIKGDTNISLFRALRHRGITGKNLPILSFAVSEEEFANLTPSELEGHYAATTYFHSIDSERNREFLKRVEKRFGAERIVSDQMQSTYALVHAWARAVKSAGTDDCTTVRKSLCGVEFDAPQGRVVIAPTIHHLVQLGRVGAINEKGRFEDVYVAPRPIQPEPFPASRPRQEWEKLVNDLHLQWGGQWHNPGPRSAAKTVSMR